MKVQIVCLLLGLLSAVDLDFYQKHVIENMQPDECTTVMQTRHIKGLFGGCKKVNTFLLGAHQKVQDICAGISGQKIVNFNVVVCKHDDSSLHPNCIYAGQTLGLEIVVIRCKDGVPVHLDKTVQIG
uniref:Ribonuclease A-domain domain-containing protein n=1 Tax=Oreochromis niloticus TaxID=8128 RepID=A0A669D6W3_ORENI